MLFVVIWACRGRNRQFDFEFFVTTSYWGSGPFYSTLFVGPNSLHELQLVSWWNIGLLENFDFIFGFGNDVFINLVWVFFWELLESHNLFVFLLWTSSSEEWQFLPYETKFYPIALTHSYQWFNPLFSSIYLFLASIYILWLDLAYVCECACLRMCLCV